MEGNLVWYDKYEPLFTATLLAVGPHWSTGSNLSRLDFLEALRAFWMSIEPEGHGLSYIEFYIQYRNWCRRNNSAK